MTLRNTADRYGVVAMTLHWLLAVAILGMLGLGLVMVDLPPGSSEQFGAYQLHKSVGITILGLTAVRLVWRLINPVPPLPQGMARWERVAARVSHVSFYVLMVAVPLSGWAMVSASPWNIPTVLYGIIPLPHLPILSTLSDKAGAEPVLKGTHEALAWAMLGLAVLHVAAALRHQVVLRDGLMWRMVPRPGGIRREARVKTLIAAAVLLVGGIGPAAAEVWSVVPDQSRLGFVGTQGGQRFEGRFEDWSASIRFDPAAPQAASVTVTIRMASAVTGDGTRDRALPQPDWFDVAAFPEARFETADIRPLGGDRYEAHGTLTIRGTSLPVILPFALAIEGDTARMKGGLSLVRTDYGVGQGAWSTGQVVALDVAVEVDLTAKR